MIDNVWLYAAAFAGALVLTLALTPLVREMNRRFGMVDLPDARRINKVPIPRGGGLAVYLAVVITLVAMELVFADRAGDAISARYRIILPFAGLMTLLGYADDKFSLSPKVKLLGQIAIAAMSWWFMDIGFRPIWPVLPAALDCAITVFWIVGAVNAFNLIDGLDGLASGLAFIATVGMAGALIFTGHASGLVFYFLFSGALLGFLRYNYNPASVFLGDSGSMFIGYTVAVLPLVSHATNSFLVSVGVPLLAMGVPIFDTSLAIVRRIVRRLLAKSSGETVADGDSAEVTKPDHDHLHHRILRAAGFNQRKAAWTLYAMAIAAVSFGVLSSFFQSRAEAIWLLALAVAVAVVFHDMSRVEFFDMGRLANTVAHSHDTATRRRWSRIAIPLYLAFDLLSLAGVFCLCCWLFHFDMQGMVFRKSFLVRIMSVLIALVAMRTYRTAWSRALASNYVRLFAACLAGAVAGSVVMAFWTDGAAEHLMAFTFLYAALSFIALMAVRIASPVGRDFFYALDCSRLIRRKDVSRVLVYGAGIRYRAFRRELVRRTAANDRIIVGLLDDDVLLKGHYIGGLRILGTIKDAPAVINAVNADHLVIACEISDEWMMVVRKILAPTGIRVSVFTLQEKGID